MASGMGLFGNVGRCFKHFEDFSICMKGSDDPILSCRTLRNDYLDCLHHKNGFLKQLQNFEQKIENEKIVKEGGGGGAGGHNH